MGAAIMLFVAIGQLKSTGSLETRNRHQFTLALPPGVTIVGEYWTGNASARVVLVFRAAGGFEWDQVVCEWEDYVSFTITPAIDVLAEEGALTVVSEFAEAIVPLATRDASHPVKSLDDNQAAVSDSTVAPPSSLTDRHAPEIFDSAQTTRANLDRNRGFSASGQPARRETDRDDAFTDETPSYRSVSHSLEDSSCDLTRREREILELLSEGQSNREIASDLFISIRTVERHIANLYRKLDFHSRAEAIAWSYKHGRLTTSA